MKIARITIFEIYIYIIIEKYIKMLICTKQGYYYYIFTYFAVSKYCACFDLDMTLVLIAVC